jgi:hypothetical protein
MEEEEIFSENNLRIIYVNRLNSKRSHIIDISKQENSFVGHKWYHTTKP